MCARILSGNPGLTARDVREIIAQSCRKIDADGGSYDERGHSPFYGFGCLDPIRAIEIADQKSAALSV